MPGKRTVELVEPPKPKKTATIKFPKTMAACADLLFEVKQARLAADKVAAELKSKESQIIEHIINNLPKSEATGVAGKLARATIVVKTIPVVKDWDKFYAYVKKNSAFELLQRRLSESAVEERWEQKKTVPGVETFKRSTVSLTRVKGKE